MSRTCRSASRSIACCATSHWSSRRHHAFVHDDVCATASRVPEPRRRLATQGFVIAGTAYSYHSVAHAFRLALVPRSKHGDAHEHRSGAAPGSTGRAAAACSSTSGAIRGALRRRLRRSSAATTPGSSFTTARRSAQGVVIMIVGGDLVLLCPRRFMLVSPQRATAQLDRLVGAGQPEVQVEQASLPRRASSTRWTERRSRRSGYRRSSTSSKVMPRTLRWPNSAARAEPDRPASGVELSLISPTPSTPTIRDHVDHAPGKGDFYPLDRPAPAARSLAAASATACSTSPAAFSRSSRSAADGQGTALVQRSVEHLHVWRCCASGGSCGGGARVGTASTTTGETTSSASADAAP